MKINKLGFENNLVYETGIVKLGYVDITKST